MKIEMKNCFKEYNIAKHTTLKVGGDAKCAYFPESTEELAQIVDFHKAQNEPITVIGAGSNILVSSKGISGALIFTKNLSECAFENGYVKAGAGLKSTMLSKFCLSHNLSGLEFLIGIPGLVGGAVYMNSGAHGQQIKDTIVSAEVFDIEKCKVVHFSKEDLGLDYRHSSIIDGKQILVSAVFEPKEGDAAEIQKFMTYQLDYRTKNHPPVSEPNAGSTFRNPEKGVAVGKLLEDLGAKDWVEGGAKISNLHSNFLYNFNNATSLDISRLMHRMYSEVKANHGYELWAEIRYLGEKTEEEKEIWNQFQKSKH